MIGKDDIEKIWSRILVKYEKHLKQYGIALPRLQNPSGGFTKDALTLVFLAQGYPRTKWVSKRELTAFIRQFYPETNDVQSARHLGMQKGFYIVSSRRGNFYPKNKPPPKESAYLLVTLKKPHPSFIPRKRMQEIDDAEFERIKQEYGYRCATCGSEEGKENFRYPRQTTKLQKAHCNPHQPLVRENIIPQCQFCNRADRNWWVYDKRGRVVGVADSEPVIRERILTSRAAKKAA